MVNFKAGQNIMYHIIYYILKGRLSVHIVIQARDLCERSGHDHRLRARSGKYEKENNGFHAAQQTLSLCDTQTIYLVNELWNTAIRSRPGCQNITDCKQGENTKLNRLHCSFMATAAIHLTIRHIAKLHKMHITNPLLPVVLHFLSSGRSSAHHCQQATMNV